MIWYAKVAVAWIGSFIEALWDSLIYKWNDSVLTWDGQSKGNQNWFDKNIINWKSKN